MHAQRSCEGYIGFNVFEWSVSQSVRQSVSPVFSTLFRCADYRLHYSMGNFLKLSVTL